ncbi:MAG: TonB-dependent receptor [Tenacibaculum sp.]
MKKITFLIFAIGIGCLSWAQVQISGIVNDFSNNLPLPGANIVEKGTKNGTTTDFDGKFKLAVQQGAIIVVSYSGFETQEIAVNGKTNFNIVLKEGIQLEQIVVTGSRTPARSNTSSPLPVDIVGVEELQATGQTTFDKALQYKIPSFNSVNSAVQDATSILDPFEIRNMGPSRTLVLINGKRKNLSALLYIQAAPGVGETGVDISAIPTDAIKSVQILRDGASAQYGSDAIAGVMNIILKDNYKNGSATFRAGITGKGDGEMLGVSVNNGSKVGQGKGFINYTIDFSKRVLANRPGVVDAQGEVAEFYNTTDPSESNFVNPDEALAFVEEFLSRRPDAGNINGVPETTAAKFLINGAVDLKNDNELYFNAAYVYKKVNSFANYRTPYWQLVETNPYLANFFPGGHPTNPNGYDGYGPTLDGDLNDYNGTIGFKSIVNGWNLDMAATFGGNKQTYTVSNSHNSSFVYRLDFNDLNNNGIVDNTDEITPVNLYRENSPINFNSGGTAFNHIVGNIDISKTLSEQIALAFGTEFRTENFEIIEGDVASYEQEGSDSFAGNRAEDSKNFNRYNLGAYLSLDWDINKDFLLSGTVRAENYSDFGSTFVWKLSSRYKFVDDKYTLRTSFSTGFRAPTLHQIYTQKSQYLFSEGGIQIQGLINNISPQAKLLKIPSLTSEKSNNFTIGIGARPTKNFSFTIDYYNIAVNDRIILSGALKPPQTSDFETLSNIAFFTNAINSKTSGLDFVFNYKNINLGTGKLGLNLSGNYTIRNEVDGTVKNPPFATSSEQSVITPTREALVFTSRPKTKWIQGATYDIGNFNFLVNNTYFGKAVFKQTGLDENLRTEFTPKIVTDLGVNFNMDSNWTISFNANNVLNVLPQWNFKAENATGQAILNDPAQVKVQSNIITFNQRYPQVTYDAMHFNKLGSIFNLAVNYKF